MNVLYINHTAHKSGAGISLGTLVKNGNPEITPYFLLPGRCTIQKTLGAAPERTHLARFIPQLMTTVYTPQLSWPLRAWHFAKVPLAFAQVRKLCARWSIDLVHVNETTLVPYAFAAFTVGRPVVLHARTALATDRPVERALIRRAGQHPRFRMIAIDGEVEKTLPESCRAVCDVIYNPVDLGPAPAEQEVRDLRQRWGVPPDAILVGQVASLHDPKGIWDIVDLATELCPQYPRLYFALIGDDKAVPGEGPALRRVITQRGLTGRVLLPGYVDRLSLAYAALEVALCLFGKGLGGVGRPAYEAALAGKALVATLPDPQSSETLRHGETALLYASDNLAGVREGLTMLINDALARKTLGERARVEIGARHSPDRVASRVFEIYKRLLAA